MNSIGGREPKPNVVRCPDELELERFLAGTSTPDARALVGAHVDLCADCREWLAQARRDDELVPALAHACETSPLTDWSGIGAGAPPHYRILRRIGAGGMGVVFEAEQERPRRSVALKILAAGASLRAMRRFEVEAEALARLDHDGIARIFEAGVFESASGPVPFFAMELVRGSSLVEHLGAESPSLRARVALFARIAEAVAHAHRNGVIHRDLKPANVLVASDGRPKIVDFGVARLSGEVDATRCVTEPGQLVGTIAYMSPEQARGDPSRVDTRTDVYALGVVLYEMLTGSLPYDLRGKSVTDAVRTIESTPPFPPRARVPRIDRDLETIVLRAIEKRPDDRYGSVDDLLADVRRLLRHEPIVARPPTAPERLRKLVRRHRVASAATAMVVAALVVGLAATAQQARRARIAGREALRQAEHAGAAFEFLRGLLSGPQDGVSARPAGYTLRAALDDATRSLDASRVDDPALEARLRLTLGTAYSGLGLASEAERNLERAVEFARAAHGASSLQAADAANALAAALSNGGEHARAIELFRGVLALYDEALEPNDARVATARTNLGAALLELARHDEAEIEIRRAVASFESGPGRRSTSHALALAAHASVHGWHERYDDAVACLESALAIYGERLGSEHPHAQMCRVVLADLLAALGLTDEALPMLREAADSLERFHGTDHPEVARASYALAKVLASCRMLDESLALAERALDVQLRALGDHPDAVATLVLLAGIHEQRGDSKLAAAALRAAIEIEERRGSRPDSRRAELEARAERLGATER